MVPKHGWAILMEHTISRQLEPGGLHFPKRTRFHLRVNVSTAGYEGFSYFIGLH